MRYIREAGTGRARFNTLSVIWYALFHVNVERKEEMPWIDRQCPTCRTSRGFMSYWVGPWRIYVNVRSVLGAILREVHAWRRPRSPYCKFDYSI